MTQTPALEASTSFVHKATGIKWRCATDTHAAAPFTLQLHNPRKRGLASFHRFVSPHHREKYVGRCIENAAQIDRHIAANFYPTPPEATRALLSVETFDGPIWEPACGKGHIAKVLEQYGHKVIATDLNDWGYGRPHVDFLEDNCPPDTRNACHIITNPPYGKGLADAFVKKALAITERTSGKVAMLLNLASLAHEGRTAEWQKNPPARLYAIDGVVCWPDTDRQPPKHFTAHRYVWAVWEHGHRGPSSFWWLSAKAFRKAAQPKPKQHTPNFATATAMLMNTTTL
jgi:hypothetical protein